MTRNSKNEYSKNEYSKNEYSKNGYEKSEYSKNKKNSRDCNHVKDREMSSYGQQNRARPPKMLSNISPRSMLLKVMSPSFQIYQLTLPFAAMGWQSESSPSKL